MAKRFYPKAYEPKPKKKRKGIHSKNRNTNNKNVKKTIDIGNKNLFINYLHI